MLTRTFNGNEFGVVTMVLTGHLVKGTNSLVVLTDMVLITRLNIIIVVSLAI